MALTPQGMPAPSFDARGYYRHAHVVGLLLVAIVATRVHELFPSLQPLRPAMSAGLAGTALLLFRSNWRVMRDAVRDPVFILAMTYFLWAILTAPFSLWPSHAMRSAISQMVPVALMLFAIFSCAPTVQNLTKLKLAFLGAATVHGAYLLVAGPRPGGRLMSTGSLDPNDLAVLMVLGFPIAVSSALQARGVMRVVWFASAAVCTTVVIETGSRGGTLALAAAAAVLIATFPGWKRGLALLLVTVGLWVTWNYAPAEHKMRMRELFAGTQDYNYTEYEGRKQIWARARGYIKARPLSGVGMNTFPVAEGNERQRIGLPGKWSTTHNTYLQAAAELGVIGFAIYLALLLRTLHRAFWLSRPFRLAQGRRSAEPEYLAALAGFLVGAAFLSHAYFYAFFAMIGLIAFAYRVRRAAVLAPAGMVTAPAPQIATPSQQRRSRVRGFRSLRTEHFRPR